MIELKQSPVIFDEDSHTYHLGDKRLAGITGLIHSVLGLGVYPEAGDYQKDYVIPRAGSRGTAIHHAIQTYDEIGVKATDQMVRTRYGCKERDNLRYEDEQWDVSLELENYIRHLTDGGFEPLANELTVSDNDKFASQIDNVWLYKRTQGIWLVDTKSNNVDLYPTCGYYNDNCFINGEDALKEYLSWQLSIYAEFFEAENPGLKVEGLACNWLRKERSAFWIIERKPSDLVRELLSSDVMFIDGQAVYFHRNPAIFGVGTNPVVRQAAKPIVSSNVVDYVAKLMRDSAEIELKLTEAKAALQAAMMSHGINKYDFGAFKATLSAGGTTTAFESKRLKEENPDLYTRYLTTQQRKGYLTLKNKSND